MLRGLLDDAFFEVLGEVGADFSGSTFSGYLGDVGLDHDADEVFERGLVGVPAELCLGLGGVTPEVHHVSRSVKVFADSDDGLDNQGIGTADNDTAPCQPRSRSRGRKCRRQVPSRGQA